MHREHKSTFKDLLGGRFLFLPIVWVGIGLSVFQQLVGINVAFYYSATLWQSVGIDPTDSFFYSFTTSIINIIGTVIAMIFVDRVGRKPLALIGSVGMAIALAARGLGLLRRPGRRQAARTPRAVVALIAAHVFVLFFALSWGVVVWVFLGEMFPNRIRAAALGVAASAQWIANWAITASFPSPGRLEPLGDLHHLHGLRRALHPLRAQVREGDQGQGAGGDGLTASLSDVRERASPRCPSPRTRWPTARRLSLERP